MIKRAWEFLDDLTLKLIPQQKISGTPCEIHLSDADNDWNKLALERANANSITYARSDENRVYLSDANNKWNKLALGLEESGKLYK